MLKDTKKELQLHKELIRDLMRQVNSTMTSHLQLYKLIELIIRMILKQHKCQECPTNKMKDNDTSDEDENDKTTSSHKQDHAVTKNINKVMNAGKSN